MRHGTQEELDAAKQDATLLPFDALFVSNYGETECSDVFRVENEYDNSYSVAFANVGEKWDFHDSSLLRVLP